MKTLSSMYVVSHVGMMALIHSSTFYMPSLFTQKLYIKFNKIQINSVESKIKLQLTFAFISLF